MNHFALQKKEHKVVYQLYINKIKKKNFWPGVPNPSWGKQFFFHRGLRTEARTAGVCKAEARLCWVNCLLGKPSCSPHHSSPPVTQNKPSVSPGRTGAENCTGVGRVNRLPRSHAWCFQMAISDLHAHRNTEYTWGRKPPMA